MIQENQMKWREVGKPYWSSYNATFCWETLDATWFAPQTYIHHMYARSWGCAWCVPEQFRSMEDPTGDWARLWPIESWTKDRCGCPVMPGARALAADRLSPVAPWIRHVLAKSYECSIGLGSWEFGVSRIVYCRDNKGRWNGWAGGNMDYCRSWGIGRVLKWRHSSSCPLDVLRLSFLTAPTIHTPIKTHHQSHGHQSFPTHHHFSKLLTWNGILYAHPHTHTAILVSVFLKDTSSRQKLVQVQGSLGVDLPVYPFSQ